MAERPEFYSRNRNEHKRNDFSFHHALSLQRDGNSVIDEDRIQSVSSESFPRGRLLKGIPYRIESIGLRF